MNSDISNLQDFADRIRKRVFRYTIENSGGYLSQACSAAEMLACLYQEVLNLGESIADKIPKPFVGVPGPDNKEYTTGADYHGERNSQYDRFFVSPAHYALVIYSALIEAGRMDAEGLALFNKDGSSVEMIGAEHSPGMEVTNGSLSQTLSIASGVAWAKKKRGDSGKVWVMLSDGEYQEGQTWECFQLISSLQLDNINIIVDSNGQQCDGLMDDVIKLGDINKKIESFGLEVHNVDGHNISEILRLAKLPHPNKALLINCITDPCKGIDVLKERAPRLHYVRFKSEEEKNRFAELGAKQLNITL